MSDNQGVTPPHLQNLGNIYPHPKDPQHWVLLKIGKLRLIWEKKA